MFCYLNVAFVGFRYDRYSFTCASNYMCFDVGNVHLNFMEKDGVSKGEAMKLPIPTKIKKEK